MSAAGEGSARRRGRLLLRERLYSGALAAARGVLPLARRLDDKLARGLEGRRGAVERLERWAAAGRDPERPLIWVHAPSVGEGLMAQAIMLALRAHLPGAQLAFTHFSPSAEKLAARIGADVADYLPWDLARDGGRALDALRPAALVWVRTEAWPVLSALACVRGVRLALVNAVLSAHSSRLRGPARYLLGPTYRRLDVIGAVTAADAERFRQLGVPAERVRVTGDARFDQVWARVQRLHLDQPVLRLLQQKDVVTVVAGSTWRADEERLIPAFVHARDNEAARWRLIIAPHEPSDAQLAALEARLTAAGLRHARLAHIEAGEPPPEVVVVDRLGVLADLYALGDLAYVGGGFHAAGLHSLIEPAALGRPVIFGPTHGNAAREARELEECGAGFEVSDLSELESCLGELGAQRGIYTRHAASSAAESYVRSHLGGAEANARLVLEQLGALG